MVWSLIVVHMLQDLGKVPPLTKYTRIKFSQAQSLQQFNGTTQVILTETSQRLSAVHGLANFFCVDRINNNMMQISISIAAL